MTHRMLRLAVLVSLSSFLTADATAQDSDGSQDLSVQNKRRISSPLGAVVVTDPREQALGLAEDTEIMGQILDDAVEGLYQGQWNVIVFVMGSGQPKRPSPGKIRSPHAVYLDGYGVVYQLEAPLLHHVPKPKKVKAHLRPAPKPLTLWEKTRRQLRGEKVESAGAANASPSGFQIVEVTFEPLAKAPTEEQMVGKLLAVLSKNGHNFQQLTPEERLTVAITFRKPTAKSQPKKKTSGAGGPMGMGMAGMSGAGSSPLIGGGGLAGVGWGRPVGKVSKSNDETTGDLHVRQRDYKQAIEAYEKALGQSFISGGGFVFYKRGDLLPAKSISPKNRRLMQRLGQAQIGAGNFDKARQVLDYLSRAEAAASKANEKDSLQFPAQLVVSVKKADLDAIAAGKIKPEEFRKRASVRYFDPGTFKQKESKSGQENGNAQKTTNLKGVIRHIDATSKLVWINLGASDSLAKRAVFDVYSKVQATTTTKTQPTDVKGRIEVTRIIGPHLAEARIVDDNLLSPIAAGNAVIAKTARSSKGK